jgi:hypothetical protein
MTPTDKTGDTKGPTSTAQGDRDRIIEQHVAQVNGHDLAVCEGWNGPLTPEERRDGAARWYTFYACNRCSIEATRPPHRWETIACEAEASDQ